MILLQLHLIDVALHALQRLAIRRQVHVALSNRLREILVGHAMLRIEIGLPFGEQAFEVTVGTCDGFAGSRRTRAGDGNSGWGRRRGDWREKIHLEFQNKEQ